MMDFTATYSPEDNKLRLYAVDRLDEETYAQAKKLGFRWAPKQELFVKPRWTPQAEDFLTSLAGEIQAEQSTMVERAEAKIDRLETIQENAERRANGFSDTAQHLSEAFSFGQPILVGHHSERKARKTAEKMNRAQDNAIKEHEKVKHYDWKKAGVAYHANRKADAGTRQRRIKTLLADLRDMQRNISDAEKKLARWNIVESTTDKEKQTEYASYELNYGNYRYGMWSDHKDGKISTQDVIKKCLTYYSSEKNLQHRQRWIMHILNRLGYEQSELCTVPVYEGEITAALIQTFCRTHGADKPKAHKEDDFWIVESAASLPVHIGNGCTLSLEADEWRTLMQSVGYSVPAKKETKAQAPLLNFRAEKVTVSHHRGEQVYDVVEMTKAEYAKIWDDGRFTMKSIGGSFRVRAFFQCDTGGSFRGEYKIAFLTDSKEHAAPESLSNVAA